jgi:dihydrofolate reductase
LAKLIYIINTSLDAYIEDADGNFDWSEPDELDHDFYTELLRPVGTQLLGRRMYEMMAVWQEPPADWPQPMQDFGRVWQDADKVVYSRTLAEPATPRTRIEREFDAEAVRQLKASADRDIAIAGPELAAHAIAAGLVDEYHAVVWPVIVGGGKPWLPRDVRVNLELVEERRIGKGAVYLRYRTAAPR